jgi:hypothetical protein
MGHAENGNRDETWSGSPGMSHVYDRKTSLLDAICCTDVVAVGNQEEREVLLAERWREPLMIATRAWQMDVGNDHLSCGNPSARWTTKRTGKLKSEDRLSPRIAELMPLPKARYSTRVDRR